MDDKKELKHLNKKELHQQIAASSAEIVRAQQVIEQNRGVISYCEFMLKNYELPEEAPSEPKKESPAA